MGNSLLSKWKIFVAADGHPTHHHLGEQDVSVPLLDLLTYLGVVLEQDAVVADLVDGHHDHAQVLHQRLLLELLLEDHVEAIEEDVQGGHEE